MTSLPPIILATAIAGPSAVPRGRTLVLCFDGTGDQFDSEISNVVKFFQLLQKDDHSQQMVYYQAGIGTYTVSQVATPVIAKLNKTIDMAIASSLDAHVMEGYTFLMQNYQTGDKICLFGFSRGAYTARALAGMVHKVGLLPANNHQQVQFAYRMYTRTDNTGWDQSADFKRAFSMDVDIEFVGVWDTVCSVGLFPRTLPFTYSNTAIRYFRHALSLDERRAKFKANVYKWPTSKESMLGVQPGQMPGPSPPAHYIHEWDITTKAVDTFKTINKSTSLRRRRVHVKAKDIIVEEEDGDYSEDDVDAKHEKEYNSASEQPSAGLKRETDVLEVWFSGCHCDVGGGSVKNHTRHSLARIPLRWMIRQCFEANTGIRFHTSLLLDVGIDPASLYPQIKPRPPALYVTDIVEPANYELLEAAAMVPATAATVADGSVLNSTPSTPAFTASPRPPMMHTRTDSARTLVDEPSSPVSKFINTATSAPTIHATTLARLRDPHAPPGMLTEEEEDLADALCPLYDALQIQPAWWILEVIPLEQRTQDPITNNWHTRKYANWGRGRELPVPPPSPTGALPPVKMHRSVDLREQAGELVLWSDGGTRAYVPRATWKPELRVEFVA